MNLRTFADFPANSRQGQLSVNRRGAMLVLIAALMSVFLIAVVFTVDVAYMQLVRTQLRVATDASAKAGMEALTRTENVADARQSAKRLVELNTIAGRSIQIQDSDIQFGRTVANADGTWQFLPNQRPYQAINVTVNLSEETGNDIPLFFGRILGYHNFTPKHTSTAANLVHEIILCLDRSHSMCFDLSGPDYAYPSGTPAYPEGYITPPNRHGSRWSELDGAIQRFVEIVSQLQIQPDIGVITWGSDLTLTTAWRPHHGRSFPAVTVDVPLGRNLNLVTPAITSRYSDIMMGGTNMAAGLDRSIQLLRANTTHSLAQKTIILMSDGQWNQGRNPLLSAHDAAAQNVTIHTISFINGGDTTMREIANLTGGKFYQASDGAALTEVFEELAKMLPVVLID